MKGPEVQQAVEGQESSLGEELRSLAELDVDADAVSVGAPTP